jgi:putative ATPase
MEDVEKNRTIPVPRHLRDAHYKGAQSLGHTGYQYAHDFPEGYVPQEYLGVEKHYYRPTDRGKEAVFGQYLAKLQKIREEHQKSAPPETSGNEGRTA